MRAHAETVKVLLEGGASMAAKDWEGKTALLCAAGFACRAVVAEALLDGGADVSDRCVRGRTAVHSAAQRGVGSSEMVLLLVGRGADVNARDSDGCSPLHVALGTAPSITNAAVALLACGADPDARDDQGRTPAVELENTPGWDLLQAWRAGTHPLQRERRAVESAVLSASRAMPEAVARVLGEYVHLGPCCGLLDEWVPVEQRRLDACVSAAARVCALLEEAVA
jgi:hypothetical protein